MPRVLRASRIICWVKPVGCGAARAIALCVVLQIAVAHIGFLNTAFGTVPLSWD
jgi:hypothetical protein